MKLEKQQQQQQKKKKKTTHTHKKTTTKNNKQNKTKKNNNKKQTTKQTFKGNCIHKTCRIIGQTDKDTKSNLRPPLTLYGKRNEPVH